MTDVPVTFLYDFDHTDDYTRRHVMHEFAANGAENLVLCDFFLQKMFGDVSFGNKLTAEMEAEGLKFVDSHCVFGKYLDLNCPVKEARNEMILRHKLALQMISAMGVNTITIHVGNETAFPEYPLEEQFDCIRRSLDELLPAAEALGVTICIENIWFQLNTPERLLKLKSYFPTEALGFCYDAGHANLMDKGRNFPDSNPVKAWKDKSPSWDDHILEKMLPYVVNCHLHDNNGISDQHRNIGNGTIDWDHIFPLLLKAPKLKVIQSEVIPLMANEAVCDICEGFDRLCNKH